jgi:cyclase
MYNRPRLIPCLTIINNDLVKTIKFSSPRYLGDPINAVRIFNGKFVDELCILDISCSKEGKEPNFELLEQIASQAFVPLSYGGGITRIDQITRLFKIGFEKVVLNTSFINNPDLVRQASSVAGSQSIVVSVDVKTDIFGKKCAYILDGTKKVSSSPVELAKLAEQLGAGEIFLNSIDHDGMMDGYDLPLIKSVADAVTIPVVACGGAKDPSDFRKAIHEAGAHAAAAGSLYVFYGRSKAVLITSPSEHTLIDNGVYLG